MLKIDDYVECNYSLNRLSALGVIGTKAIRELFEAGKSLNRLSALGVIGT